jgi:hypothetical protein
MVEEEEEEELWKDDAEQVDLDRRRSSQPWRWRAKRGRPSALLRRRIRPSWKASWTFPKRAGSERQRILELIALRLLPTRISGHPKRGVPRTVCEVLSHQRREAPPSPATMQHREIGMANWREWLVWPTPRYVVNLVKI